MNKARTMHELQSDCQLADRPAGCRSAMHGSGTK
jgi:hypothetical protein